MPDRRSFLQGGVAAGVAVTASGAPAFAASLADPRPAFFRVVVDDRLPGSVLFGREAVRRGETVHAMTGVITGFWVKQLHRRWSNDMAPIAGVTAHGPFFCMEQLARISGFRVLFTTEHAGIDGRSQAAIWNRDNPGLSLRAESPAHVWAQRFGEIARGAALGDQRCTVASGPGLFPDDDPCRMISWVVGPKHLFPTRA
ncbi:hypothetical protein BV96_02931 [Sphingomonas paucimobilis]|nr:hypothetical protein BV96_02931 [Sphingomonas paucimobilis]